MLSRSIRYSVLSNMVFLSACLALFAPPVGAAEDVEGADDHPRVERIAGSFIEAVFGDEYKRVTLPAGPFDRSERAFTEIVTLEGDWLKLVYGFEEEDISALRIHRSFVQTLAAADFDILFEGSDLDLIMQGSGRSAQFLLAVDESYLLTRRGPIQQRQPVHYLLARSRSEPVHVAVSTYEAPGSGVQYVVNVITEEAMVVAMEHRPLSASEMEEGLISEGRVAIQNILFAFDSDEILPESSEALVTIAALMRDRPELGLLVVGHSDDVGDFDYNLRLSMQRATAVVDYLKREHSIAQARLRSAGAGMMAPIASNRTESGRALNRRVELVEIRDSP